MIQQAAKSFQGVLNNREALLPTREQLKLSVETLEAARDRLKGLRIEFVLPDYYAKYPKPCMNGWGHSLMLIDPAGRVMPCHAAPAIHGMEFANARDHALGWIWEKSPAFTRFRGEDWMPEPCKGCDRRERDFGGCRCQAFMLTGDAAATDPVCILAPAHSVVENTLVRINSDMAGATSDANAGWVHRIDPEAVSRPTA